MPTVSLHPHPHPVAEVPRHDRIAKHALSGLAQRGDSDLILAHAVFPQRRNSALAQLKAYQSLSAALLHIVQQDLFGEAKLPARTHAFEVLLLIPRAHITR